MVPVLSSLVALIILVVFVLAIRVSYAIERVTKPRPPGALPRFTNVIAAAFARKVDADDHDTMGLVKRLRILLLIVLVLFTGLAIIATRLG